jgi:hypothetical protein
MNITTDSNGARQERLQRELEEAEEKSKASKAREPGLDDIATYSQWIYVHQAVQLAEDQARKRLEDHTSYAYTKVPTKPMPMFKDLVTNTKEDVQKFINDVRDHFEAHMFPCVENHRQRWSPLLRTAVSNLREEDHDLLHAIRDKPWEEASKEFIKRFTRTGSVARDCVEVLSQTVRQSAGSRTAAAYNEAFNKKASKTLAPALVEDAKWQQQCFIYQVLWRGGLLDSLKAALAANATRVAECGNDLQRLQSLAVEVELELDTAATFAAAQQASALHSPAGRSRNPLSNRNRDFNGRKRDTPNTKRQHHPRLAAGSSSNGKGGTAETCTRCGKPNHHWSDCRSHMDINRVPLAGNPPGLAAARAQQNDRERPQHQQRGNRSGGYSSGNNRSHQPAADNNRRPQVRQLKRGNDDDRRRGSRSPRRRRRTRSRSRSRERSAYSPGFDQQHRGQRTRDDSVDHDERDGQHEYASCSICTTDNADNHNTAECPYLGTTSDRARARSDSAEPYKQHGQQEYYY